MYMDQYVQSRHKLLSRVIILFDIELSIKFVLILLYNEVTLKRSNKGGALNKSEHLNQKITLSSLVMFFRNSCRKYKSF